jgi:predicted NUDIX family phosphoesterase
MPLFNEQEHTFMPRERAEKDPSFKQLIPYIMIWNEDGVAAYWRGSGQGESRLHGKRSIGFGGHINSVDADMAIGGSAYERGLARELEEEVVFTPKPDFITPYIVGLLNDDSTEVGKVHLGIVHYLDMTGLCKITAKEADIAGLEFLRLEDLVANRDQFETWSQYCIDELVLQLQMSTLADADPQSEK